MVRNSSPALLAVQDAIAMKQFPPKLTLPEEKTESLCFRCTHTPRSHGLQSAFSQLELRSVL
ncbi:hypothetical protein JG687_00002497 [Phytophthora cactorum]|uniref:Uncharacterized protein n=1 Tax=Phytophthora cactorum TaxID=29920 RepID=A0A8T1UVB6_9STRA|nr:hypothetical protein JG687_00002497 [Phytophthora cactorum]